MAAAKEEKKPIRKKNVDSCPIFTSKIGTISSIDAVFLVFWMQMHVVVALNPRGCKHVFLVFFVKVIILEYLNLYLQANLLFLDMCLVF